MQTRRARISMERLLLFLSALVLGCLATRGALAKEHLRHYSGHVRVWAFTSVAADYDGATILRHWVNHYMDLGVKPENFLVVVNSKTGRRTAEVEACTSILDSHGISYVLWLSQYSSEDMYKFRLELQEKVDVNDWIIHADSDEFHYYGGKSAVDFLEVRGAKGAGHCSQFISQCPVDPAWVSLLSIGKYDGWLLFGERLARRVWFFSLASDDNFSPRRTGTSFDSRTWSLRDSTKCVASTSTACPRRASSRSSQTSPTCLPSIRSSAR